MSANHHLQAKLATDSILSKFKTSEWDCVNNIGTGLYRVGCDSSFPSPDAAFFEDSAKMMITFEFKPPTETKRGILTGLGQSIAYLSNSNLSYLIIPEMLEDFRIADYMTDLFSKQIKDNLPVGLIKYDNNNPTNVSLIKNVQTTSNTIECSSRNTSRFWAKHQDLPLPLFHLMLHCYYLKKTGVITGDAFAYCWSHYMAPDTILETMKPALVVDLSGNPIKTLSGSKNISFFEKKINTYKKCEDRIYFANKMSKKKIKTTPLKQIKRYNLVCQRVASSEKQVNNKINEKEMRKTVVIILPIFTPRNCENEKLQTFY